MLKTGSNIIIINNSVVTKAMNDCWLYQSEYMDKLDHIEIWNFRHSICQNEVCNNNIWHIL